MRYHRGKADYYKYLTPAQIRAEKIISTVCYILTALISAVAFTSAVFVRWEGTIFFCFLGMFAADGGVLGTKFFLLPLFEVIVGEYSNAKPIVVRKKINWNCLLAMAILIFFGGLLIFIGFREAFLLDPITA